MPGTPHMGCIAYTRLSKRGSSHRRDLRTVAGIYMFRTGTPLYRCTDCHCSPCSGLCPWNRRSHLQPSRHRTGIGRTCTALGLRTFFRTRVFIRLVLERQRTRRSAHRTCCSTLGSQSSRTRSTFRSIFHPGFLSGCTHRSPPRSSPCCCTRDRWALGGTRCHFLMVNPGCCGTVVQRMAHSIRICRTLEPRGHCSPGCFPEGSLCTHTDLRKQFR